MYKNGIEYEPKKASEDVYCVCDSCDLDADECGLWQNDACLDLLLEIFGNEAINYCWAKSKNKIKLYKSPIQNHNDLCEGCYWAYNGEETKTDEYCGPNCETDGMWVWTEKEPEFEYFELKPTNG